MFELEDGGIISIHAVIAVYPTMVDSEIVYWQVLLNFGGTIAIPDHEGKRLVEIVKAQHALIGTVVSMRTAEPKFPVKAGDSLRWAKE